MTNQQIEYVLAVAECKSFSKASQMLYITQPALSKFIMTIEDQIGCKIFDRTSVPIQLTQAGEIYVEKAKTIKMINKDLENELSDLEQLKSGVLTIGTTPFRGSCMLAKSISAFHQKYQGVKINIIEADQQKLENEILNGNIDIAISTEVPDLKFFNVEFLSQEKLYLAVSNENTINETLKDKKVDYNEIIKGDDIENAVDLSLFSKENFIILSSNQNINDIYVNICRNYGFAPNSIIKTEYLETAFAFVLSNLGVSFIPDTYIKFGNNLNHPTYYLIEDDLTYININLISKKNRYLIRAAREYSAILKHLIGIGTWVS